MFRKSVFIMLFVCLLATISPVAKAVNLPADWWIYQLEWNGSAGDANWNNPANWNLQGSGEIPNGPDANNRSCVLPNQPGPRIINAKSYLLQMNPWDPSGWGGQDVNIIVDVNATDVNMGSYIGINSSVSYDSYLGTSYLANRAILNVYGGTVHTPGPYINSGPMCGIHIGGGGDGFGLSYGMLNIYGGLVETPRLELHFGEIALNGGTLHLKVNDGDFNFAADGNFVVTTTHPLAALNKIRVNGGTLILDGNKMDILNSLITAGTVVCDRGTLGTPVYTADPCRTTIVSDVNLCAWNPSPAHNATNIHYKTADVCGVTLSWSPSTFDDADVNHDVYFGVSSSVVYLATKASPEYKGTRYDHPYYGLDANGDPCSWTIKEPNNFSVGANYYWRVDEVNSANIVKKGLIWRFTAHDGKAYNIKPGNDTNGLSIPLQLSWTAGDWASSTNGHRVYFGTASPVSTSTTDPIVYRGTQNGTTYSLANLAPNYILSPGVTYYWRIVEVNTTYGGAWASNTFSFRPTDTVTIDDFNQYQSSDEVNAVWPNGYTLIAGSCPEAWEGATGNSVRVLMRDATGKYLRYTYTNGGGGAMVFSEAQRPYTGGTSFTAAGTLFYPCRALTLSYRGDTLNAADPVYDRMYVALEDTAGNVAVYDNCDVNAAKVTTWTSWVSSLYDINAAGLPLPVNLEAVSAFDIGFGYRCRPQGAGGGDGNVMFDSIGLIVAACVAEFGPTADLDEDCDVDLGDLDALVNNWLWAAVPEHTLAKKEPNAPVIWYKFNESDGTTAADSASGYTADVCGVVMWEPTGGRDGNGCIILNTLDSDNSHVEVRDPNTAFGFLNSNGGSISISVWINADLTVGNTINDSWESFFTVYDSDWIERTSFSIPWRWGDPRVWFQSQSGNTIMGPLMPDNYFGGRWNHWAAIKDAETNTMRAYCNGSLVGSTASTTPLFTLPVQSIRIGMRGQSWANWGLWSGKAQDFKVYDYALDANEVAYEATDGSGVVDLIPLVAPANINYDGSESPDTDADQVVNFGDIATMGKQWHTQILWP